MPTIGIGLNPRSGSPYVQGARTTSPKEVMFRLRMENQQATKEDLLRLFRAEANANPELSDVCIEIAAINAYSAWEKLREHPSRSPSQERQAQRERQEASIEQASEVVARIQRAVILDFVMPNNKPLRNCTFKEVRKFGKGFQKLGMAGRPNQIVGEVLSETQAKRLMRGR
jgi:hypothetical protein